jgi:hypothetical protein
MRVSINDVARPRIPASINGQVLLDRGTSQSFATSQEFLDMLAEFQPGSLRWPTTGHSNLPRSHPMNTRHSYFFSDFDTAASGNLWDTGYTFADGGPDTEILNKTAYGTICRHLGNTRPHIFVDWQSGLSEGINNPLAPPLTYDYTWYRDPELKDIDGNSITDPGTIASLAAAGAKKLENRRLIKHLIEVEGLATNLIINMGGEDWRGWDPPFPWDPTGIVDGDDQDLFYQWLRENTQPFLSDLKSYVLSKGWDEITFCVGFLESVSGGRVYPLSENNIRRNYNHLVSMVQLLGADIEWVGCSMHYRGDWSRWLTENPMQYAFPNPEGGGSWQECCDFIADTVTSLGYPNIKLLPFANSVGDAGDFKGDHIDVPLWQRGLMGAQQKIEQIKSSLEVAQDYLGIMGDHKNAGADPVDGITGKVVTTFTKMPLYHALKTFGPILQKAPDALVADTTVEGSGLVQLVLKWTSDSGHTMLSIWLMNKQADSRTVQVAFPDAPSIIVGTVQRYSESETTNPVVSGITSISGRNLSVDMLPYSLIYTEVQIGGHVSDLMLINQAIGGPFRCWLYITTHDAETVTQPGYFEDRDGLQVGDSIDVIITDSLEPSKRTTSERLRLVVAGI